MFLIMNSEDSKSSSFLRKKLAENGYSSRLRHSETVFIRKMSSRAFILEARRLQEEMRKA
jgi:hypothetical protein